MSVGTRTSGAEPVTALSPKPEQQSTGWPRWMQEAFAYEPEMGKTQGSGTVGEPARANPQSIRILSRVSSRS